MDRLAGWLKAHCSRGAFNGTVLIADRGRICFEKHCGFTDIDGRVPLTRQSSFGLASGSKPFTAFGILLLAHQGKLALHDRIGQHIRELADYGDITIRHLLHHTSGIPDHIELANEVLDPKVILTITDLIALFHNGQIAISRPEINTSTATPDMSCWRRSYTGHQGGLILSSWRRTYSRPLA